MKIIYARMAGYDFVSTPSDAVFRELEKMGHEVFWVDNLGYLPSDKYDVVISPYESVTMLGDAIAQKMNIPHLAHIEWLPPWRVKNVVAAQYGLAQDFEELQHLDDFRKHYQHVGRAWLNADIQSLGGAAFREYLTDFLVDNDGASEKIRNCSIRHPSVDTETIDAAKRMYSPHRDPQRVLTVSRAVPNKRYDLLVKVMNQIDIPCVWAIVGEGPEVDMIKEKLQNENVTLEFIGPGWGWVKLYEMLKSSFYLGGWTGMPPVEAALLGSYPLIVRPNETDEKVITVLDENFNGLVATYPELELDQVAKDLNGYLKNSKGIESKLDVLVAEFRANKLGITSSCQNAHDLERELQQLFASRQGTNNL